MLLAHYGHLRIILPCAIRKLCISGHLFASDPIVRCSYTFVVVPRELLLTVTRMHLLCCSYPIPGRVPSINILPPELRVCHRNSVQQQFQWTQQRHRCRSWAQHDRHELHWSNICAAEQHAATHRHESLSWADWVYLGNWSWWCGRGSIISKAANTRVEYKSFGYYCSAAPQCSQCLAQPPQSHWRQILRLA